MADAAAGISVVVAYSPQPGQVTEQSVQLPPQATVADALVACGLGPADQPCGIWGKVCSPAAALQDGDRVEQYRLLTVDPKVARRERFAQQGARSSGLFAKRRPNSKAGY